ncbi:hypothetical protein MB02_12165 [Croceicoccus estronivorus]|uniref:FecR family protein n=1 Tax=Croceicoccus estronivorus TaxID=1172626 RepID=UPI000829654B|nr:FecR domain-containing protein [Croceicoccus estronivorus]OCC23368.1 hypothetical protein MB02_12165 [Croceicoccus estronivorus]
MTRAGSQPHNRDDLAEAATWLARLRSDERTGQDELAFRSWLAEDEAHAAAFLHVTDVWEASANMSVHQRRASGDYKHSRRKVLAGSLAVLTATAGGTAAWMLSGKQTYSTRVGERRRVALEDGSSLLLDTDSLATVRMSAERREIELVRGRAHFAVAKDVSRPFMVRAGSQQVIALGTAFDVDRADEETTVVLVEGQVVVRSVDQLSIAPEKVMSPGDRLVFLGEELAVADRPDMAAMSAWQSGRLVFAQETLLSAIAEFNRYNKRKLSVGDPALAAIQVSGVYDANDPEGFARSLGLLLPVASRIDGDRIVLDLNEERKKN